jgi:hypothetical protein
MRENDIRRNLNVDSDFAQTFMHVSDIHLNVSQEIIIITEDKARRCLSEHLKRVEQHLEHAKRKREWIAPLGILATLSVTLVTTSGFRDFLFEATLWNAVFLVANIGTFIWLGRTVIRAWQARDTIDMTQELNRVIAALKEGSSEIDGIRGVETG